MRNFDDIQFPTDIARDAQMPTVSSMKLPMPKNWQDFETIVLDAQAQRWKSSDLQKHGRLGQAQHGVDIWGSDDIGRPVGIQCKCVTSILKYDEVMDEIKEASEKFTARLTTLYVATTADYDAKLQQQVRLLSDKRVANGEFAVALLYWDTIVGGLVLNPAVFHAHYPQIILTNPTSINRERQLAAFELGYFGADLWEYIELIYGGYGWLAQSDPDSIIATIDILKTRAQQVLSPGASDPILECLKLVRDGCMTKKDSASDWKKVEFQAKRAQKRIQCASSLLPLAESNVLEVGIQLGHIYHRTMDLPSDATRASVEIKVRSILPTSSSVPIDSEFASSSKLTTGDSWASSIYRLVDHELRFGIS